MLPLNHDFGILRNLLGGAVLNYEKAEKVRKMGDVD